MERERGRRVARVAGRSKDCHERIAECGDVKCDFLHVDRGELEREKEIEKANMGKEERYRKKY